VTKNDDRDALEEAAVRLAGALGSDGLLVGGLAVAAWGYVRATDDVDFVARLPAQEVVRRLKAAGVAARIRKGGGVQGDAIEWCVRGQIEGVVFDILPPLVTLRFDRAVEIRLSRGDIVRVVDLGGLLRLKLKAGGPQDLLDAAQLLRRHPKHLQEARGVAEAYGHWDQLERWLNDPRLR
jgi:hypothetical protein